MYYDDYMDLIQGEKKEAEYYCEVELQGEDRISKRITKGE